jgi:hypothetical protein
MKQTAHAAGNADYSQDDSIGPTPERMRIANGELVSWPSQSESGRIITRYRIASVLEKMLEKGAITKAMYDAGLEWGEDYAKAGIPPRMTGKYGLEFEMASAIGHTRGTPVGQQRTSFEDRRAKHAKAFWDAYMAIPHRATADALVAVICEETATISDIGYAWTGYGSNKQQSAAGFAQFKIGLDMLADIKGTKHRA